LFEFETTAFKLVQHDVQKLQNSAQRTNTNLWLTL